MSVRLVSCETSLLGLQMATSSMCPQSLSSMCVYVLIPCSYEDSGHTGLGPPMTSSSLISFKTLSPRTVTL